MSKTVVVSEPNGNGKQNIEVISKSGIDDGATEVNRKKKIYLPISSDQTLDQHKRSIQNSVYNLKSQPSIQFMIAFDLLVSLSVLYTSKKGERTLLQFQIG